MNDKINIALFNAITEYDRRESKKKYYNRYALAHYAAALTNIKQSVSNGASYEDAINEFTCGSVAKCLLKALNKVKV